MAVEGSSLRINIRALYLRETDGKCLPWTTMGDDLINIINMKKAEGLDEISPKLLKLGAEYTRSYNPYIKKR